MKEKILELIPAKESELRSSINNTTTKVGIRNVLFDYIGPKGKDIWQDRTKWPEWLEAVEAVYLAD